MSAVTLVFAIVAGIVGGTATGNVILYGSPVGPPSVEALQAQKARQFARMIRNSWVMLPDSRSFLEAAHSSGMTLVLTIGTMDMKKNIDGGVFLRAMKNSVIDVLCGDAGERDVLNRGGNRLYIYRDLKGADIGEFRVDAWDCQSLT